MSVPHTRVRRNSPGGRLAIGIVYFLTPQRLCYTVAAMSGDTRVLTGLMERRALEAAFGGLGEINDPEQLQRRARALAQSGSAALSVLIAMLDTNDPQLRGGLGEVARLLDRSAVVAALRGVALAPHSPERARTSALTILDRYLHEPLDDQVLGASQAPEALSRQSLLELMDAMDGDPYALLEYMAQLDGQPAEVPYMILTAIPTFAPNPHLVTLLRVLAQGPDAALAAEALQRLGLTRTDDAARALASLTPALPADRGALAERALRKLRMSGVRDGQPNEKTEPWSLPPVTERALMTPLDPAGAQLIWFLSAPDDGGRRRVVTIVLQHDTGIVACVDLRNIAPHDLPPARPVGFLHRVAPLPGKTGPVLLEAGLAAAIAALADATSLNWRSSHPPPIEYRLINPCIWSGASALRAVQGDPVTGLIPASEGNPVALLEHPAFAGWYWWPPARFAPALWRQPNAQELLLALALEHFTPAARQAYARRFRLMADWLARAGERETAALALAAAVRLEEDGFEADPLASRLLVAGFELARTRYSTIQL